MVQVFSFRHVCENKISKVRMLDMPVGQYFELDFDRNGIYQTPCRLIIGDIYYNTPLRFDTIDPDLECFTYADNEEFFGDYLYLELIEFIKNLKNIK